MLKISKPNSKDFYYLSYCQATGSATVIVNGAAIANAGKTDFTDSNRGSGTVYDFLVGARDQEGNASAASITVTAGSTKGGGGSNGNGKK